MDLAIPPAVITRGQFQNEPGLFASKNIDGVLPARFSKHLGMGFLREAAFQDGCVWLHPDELKGVQKFLERFHLAAECRAAAAGLALGINEVPSSCPAVKE